MSGATFRLFPLFLFSMPQIPHAGRLALLATFLAAAPAVLAPAALAQGTPSNAEVTAYDAGYQTAQRLHADSRTFTAAAYREGFRAGLAADSARIAYAVGLQTGFQFRSDTVTGLDPDTFLRGIAAGFAGTPPQYDAATVERARGVFQDSLTARQTRAQMADPAVRARTEQARANGEAAQAFLAQAAARTGATVSPTGLVSVVTTPGTGPSPGPEDRVSVRYAGRFADGTEFDASPPGETVEFGVSRVVPGFSEAIQAMKVGETRTIWLPPALAYGERGAPGPGGQGGIPPNTALEFDLTLVAILP